MWKCGMNCILSHCAMTIWEPRTNSMNPFSDFPSALWILGILHACQCSHSVPLSLLSYPVFYFSPARLQPVCFFPFVCHVSWGWGVTFHQHFPEKQKQALSVDVLSTSFVPLLPSSAPFFSFLPFSQIPSIVHRHALCLVLFFLPITSLLHMPCLASLACPSLLLLHKLPGIDSGHIAFVLSVLVCLWEPQQPGPSLNEHATKAHWWGAQY